MGFKRPGYLVKFEEGHRFHGLEVTTRSIAFERMLEIQGLLDSLPSGGKQEGKSDELRRISDLFAGAFVSWNLEEDDGTPVPATSEALMKEGFDLVIAVVMAWVRMVSTAGDDLGKDLPSGPPSQVESIPMDILSGSPSN